jgi:large subunit ribosomal protein L11
MNMGKEKVDILIEGGKATAAPPIGPTLSQLKLNVGQVVADINEKTKSFAGMQVPVKLIIDTDTKKYTITVGSPPVSALIRKEMKVQKLAFIKDGNKTLPGDIKFKSILEIAKSKEIPGSMSARVKQILGTCQSGGVTVDGKSPKEVIAQINSGELKVE